MTGVNGQARGDRIYRGWTIDSFLTPLVSQRSHHDPSGSTNALSLSCTTHKPTPQTDKEATLGFAPSMLSRARTSRRLRSDADPEARRALAVG